MCKSMQEQVPVHNAPVNGLVPLASLLVHPQSI